MLPSSSSLPQRMSRRNRERAGMSSVKEQMPSPQRSRPRPQRRQGQKFPPAARAHQPPAQQAEVSKDKCRQRAHALLPRQQAETQAARCPASPLPILLQQREAAVKRQRELPSSPPLFPHQIGRVAEAMKEMVACPRLDRVAGNTENTRHLMSPAPVWSLFLLSVQGTRVRSRRH